MPTHMTFCVLLHEEQVPGFTSEISALFDLTAADTSRVNLEEDPPQCVLTYALPWWRGQRWKEIYNFLLKSVAEKTILRVHLPDIVQTVQVQDTHRVDSLLLLRLIQETPDIASVGLMGQYLSKADLSDGIFDVHALAVILNDLVQAGFLERTQVKVADLSARAARTRVGYRLTSSEPLPHPPAVPGRTSVA